MTESVRVSLASWLLERVTDDERIAREAAAMDHSTGWVNDGGTVKHAATGMTVVDWIDEPIADHLIRWDPARVLAECAARRKIIEEHSEDFDRGKCGVCLDYVTDTPGGKPLAVMEPLPCRTLRLLAAPYASEPGYRAEWAV